MLAAITTVVCQQVIIGRWKTSASKEFLLQLHSSPRKGIGILYQFEAALMYSFAQ